MEESHGLRRVLSMVLLGVTSVPQSNPHMWVPMARLVHPSVAPSSTGALGLGPGLLSWSRHPTHCIVGPTLQICFSH